MATTSTTLPFDEADPIDARIAARDASARARAVDPRFNVALEASAGTGKTRVLVDRYINLLRAGVDPANILAITFTRKAAAEMRDRIMATLRTAAARGEIPPARWRELRDRTADIAISTIDAFCLSLLREFPLEADVDPGFSVADETELPRLVDEALDRALRTCRAVAREDEDVALVFAHLGERRVRAALAGLLRRRLVAPAALGGYLARGPANLDVPTVSRRGAAGLLAVFESMRGGFERFVDTGPLDPPAFQLLVRALRQLREFVHAGSERTRPTDVPVLVQTAFARAREHFLTQDGKTRRKSPYPQRMFANAAGWRTHGALVVDHADAFARADAAYRRDLNVLLSRGVWRMFRVAEAEYRAILDAHAVLDFSDLLLRALGLLQRMDEFSRSRYRLEARYHHVLVDEFQDTSRAQWELVSLLIQSWGEGAGVAASGPLQPSIFIVGDRKQSIYAFRDADVSVLREAARYIEMLRPGGDVRRSISRSFRAAPPLLAFVNDVCHDIDKTPGTDAFEYEEGDRFPIDGAAASEQGDVLGMISAATPEECAAMAAAEIARLLADGASIRDRETGLPRPVRPADIAILFRSRETHREFEEALSARGIRSYVYKGLGFFDADEIKDVQAMISYLADPTSDRHAAALLRSRFFGVSDEALRLLAPGLADVLAASDPPRAVAALDPVDRRAVTDARESTARWRALVDRMPPADLLDRILTESAYAFETRGARLQQARENLKKIRALIRRLQNRGYATMARVAAHVASVAAGDEANAVVDALDAVNLMTVHASKGLEFPVVFVVNLARGTGNRRDPVRWLASPEPGEDGSLDAASVTVGSLQSEGDEERLAREREETKRLLYVALTRVRDRLYLATTLKDGRVVPARGSLAEILPASLLQTLASGSAGRAEWRASSGTVHGFRVPDSESPTPDPRSPVPDPQPPIPDDFAPLEDPSRRPRTATDEVDGSPYHSTDDSDRLIGLVVHRLLQRFGFASDPDAIGREAAQRMLRREEEAGMAADRTAAEMADQAVTAYRAICGRADIRALYTTGARLHEVPFTMRLDGAIVRGTIDCLIRSGSGRLTVLEFKTGRPRDEHRAQLDLYRRAAERLFPGTTVETQLVYAAPSV